MSQRTIGLLMALTTALSWAVLAIALKVALQTYSSGTIVWIRMAVAAVLMLGFAVIWRPKWLRIFRTPPWSMVLGAALLAGNYYGYMKGVEYTSASNAQILIQLSPLSFAIAGIFLHGERPTPDQIIGMVIAGIGLSFFFWDQILVSMDNLAQYQVGNLWILFAVVVWVTFALIQKKLLKTFPAQQLNMLTYSVAAVVLAPIATYSEWQATTWPSFWLIAFLSVNTVIAYGAFSEAIKRIPASHVSVIIAANPLVTIFLMTILAQMEVEWIRPEPIHWRGYLGALLVVTGVILTVSKPVRLSRRKRPSTL